MKASKPPATKKIPMLATIHMKELLPGPKPVTGRVGAGGMRAGESGTDATAILLTIKPLPKPEAVAVFVVLAVRFC